MKNLNSNMLKSISGGEPGKAGDHANENAPGGQNVLFATGTNGVAICPNGKLVKVNESPAVATNQAAGIFGFYTPTKTWEQVLIDNDLQSNCGF